jgi:cofilin
VEDLGNEDYNDFLTRLPLDQCRYSVYNFPYAKEATKKSALIFILWIPTEATRAQRKMFLTKKEWFLKKLFGEILSLIIIQDEIILMLMCSLENRHTAHS